MSSGEVPGIVWAMPDKHVTNTWQTRDDPHVRHKHVTVHVTVDTWDTTMCESRYARRRSRPCHSTCESSHAWIECHVGVMSHVRVMSHVSWMSRIRHARVTDHERYTIEIQERFHQLLSHNVYALSERGITHFHAKTPPKSRSGFRWHDYFLLWSYNVG